MSKEQKYIDKNIEESEDQTEKEFGFEENLSLPGVRLMNRDGSLNVHHIGSDYFRKLSLYKRFLKMSTWQFFLAILLFYIILNVLFASYYYAFGESGLSFSNGSFSWLDCFWFSTQTFTTVGYGHMSPSNLWVNIGASFEAFMGLIFFAIATGLVYGRFTSSKADIRFSKNIIINKSTEEPHLKLRLANFSNSDLSDLNAIIITSYIERVGNQVVRRYKKTPLELQHISLLTTSWTLIHKIGQDSPCSQLLTTNHVQGLEFLIFITAFDEIYDQKIKVRTSYTHKDIIYSAHFKPITSYDTEKALVNLDDLSSFEKI